MSRRIVSFFPIFLTVFLDFLGIALVVPIFAPMLLDVKHSILPPEVSVNTRGIILGFLTAVYPIGQFFGSPILGKLSDRHGRKPWLVLTLGGNCFGYLISGLGIVIGNIPVLFVGRLVTGFMGGNSSICQSAVADLSDEKSRGAYFGYLALAMGLGFILGPVVGGRLADPSIVSWFNFDIPFWFAALLGLLNVLMMTWFFKETIKETRQVKIKVWTGLVDIGRAFTLKGLRTMLLTFFLFTLGWFFFAQFFQVYLIQRFHFTQTQIGDTFTYIAIWYAICQGGISSPISARFSPRSITMIALPLMALTMASLLLPSHAFWLWFFYPFVVLFVCLVWPNILAMISNMTPSNQQGEVLGVNQSIQSLAQALTPIISGPLVAHHLKLPTLFAAGCAFVGWLLLLTISKSRAAGGGVKERSESPTENLPPSQHRQ